MKQTSTKTIIAILIFFLSSYSFLFAQIAAPADTTKKPAPPPPAQMLSFPVISEICKIKLSSYTQVRYQYFTDGKTPSSFDIRNARIILNGNPLRNFAYRLQVDFAPPTVRLLDGYGSYSFNNYFKLTAGQQKVPLSYESLRTDYDIHSMSRSQVVEALTGRSKDVLAGTSAVNNNGRDIGLQGSGGIAHEGTQTNWVDYYLGVFDGMGINKSDADKHKDIGVRAVVHPIKYLSVGGSYYGGKATYGTDITKPKDRNRFGFDASYEDGKWIYAAAEFLQGVDSATTKSGYYAEVEGFFIPKKGAVLFKYDFYDPNTNKSDDASTIYSLAFNWYFAPYTKMQIQYDFKHENAPTQKKNDVLSAQFQIYF